MSKTPEVSIEQFFTADAANEGRILHLTNPDGSDSGQWLRLAGLDSDFYEDAVIDNRQALRSEDKQVTKTANRKIYAACILEWSFSTPLTQGNKEKLLEQSPPVRRQIMRFIDDTEGFYAAKPTP